MIEPTVGRKVWYRPSTLDLNTRGTLSNPKMEAFPGQPLDATIVSVTNDRLVNLVIFDVYGNHHRKLGVTLLQDDDTAPVAEGYGEWMPYQVQSAKKDEPKSSSKKD